MNGATHIIYWVVLPILTAMLVAVGLMMDGHPDAAWVVSNVGTLAVLLGNGLYIVLKDPTGRWPGSGLMQRWANLLTFKR